MYLTISETKKVQNKGLKAYQLSQCKFGKFAGKFMCEWGKANVAKRCALQDRCKISKNNEA